MQYLFFRARGDTDSKGACVTQHCCLFRSWWHRRWRLFHQLLGSVVYRRKGWDYGVIGLDNMAKAEPELAGVRATRR